jgi:hypothetical protein
VRVDESMHTDSYSYASKLITLAWSSQGQKMPDFGLEVPSRTKQSRNDQMVFDENWRLNHGWTMKTV